MPVLRVLAANKRDGTELLMFQCRLIHLAKNWA